MIWILFLALLGLIISWYIFHKKIKDEKLVCLIGQDCDKVVKSQYSKTLGIPNEISGIIYYSGTAFLALASFLGPQTIFGWPILLILIITGVLAVLFSLVLTYIQLFILKEWCEYCLASAIISLLILFIEVIQ